MAAIGIVVYHIEDEGCLNGTFANKEAGTFYNEIARKSDGKETLEGDYICAYIDANDKVYTGTMTISKQDEIYHLTQYVHCKNGEIASFQGMGLKSGANQLAVSYLPE